MPSQRRKRRTIRQSQPEQEKMPIAVVRDEDEQLPQVLPILPLRGLVVYPGTIIPLQVGRPASRAMLEASLPESKIIGLVAQHEAEEEDPTFESMHSVGCAAMVLKMVRQPDETVMLLVHGIDRFKVKDVVQESPYKKARIEKIDTKRGSGKVFQARVNQLRELAQELIELTPQASEQAMAVLMNIEEPGGLADYLAANLDLDMDLRQALLEELRIGKRVEIVHEHLTRQLEMARLQHKIQMNTQENITEGQRRFFLREQMRAIQEELGEGAEGMEVLEDMARRLNEANLPESVIPEAQRELKRLEMVPPASPEYSVILTYLELLADLPWANATQENMDITAARNVLERDHHGLEKVKKRLIEHLAVRKLKPERQGPILCLVGPPGVGKTSLGRSIAESMGRKFARIALGGTRDESEIRGHRRTYIGAMPGRIIQAIKRCGSNNPVILLDEIDKLGQGVQGDPAAALLEVLDPKQNNAFVDRYLDVPFDLSQVLFLCTANVADMIPGPLYDRMEVIDLPGYTDQDKLAIAKQYLVPRQIKEHGLTSKDIRFGVSGIKQVIEYYTRESGVRELERQIGAVCRGIAADVATRSKRAKPMKITVDADEVVKRLGAQKYVRDLDTEVGTPGLALGLAYTSVGGEILFIEASSYPGNGSLQLTGHIGQVMKESAQAALTFFKANADKLGFDPQALKDKDLHIHVPAGAVPKDGPSAGCAMLTAIASLVSGKPMKAKMAMTGEITLRGRVLPIGGVKEKTLAAYRAGIKTVILPEQNRKDLEEVDPVVRQKLKFEFVSEAEELLKLVLAGRKR